MRYAGCKTGMPLSVKRTTPTTSRGKAMQTPNEYLRALLLERAEAAGLTDSAIARAHNRAYPDSTLHPSSVQRFRKGPPTEPPTPLMEEAYAAATGTTREANWDEAFQRWRTTIGTKAGRSLRQRSD